MIKEQLYNKLSQIIPDMENRLAKGTEYGKSKIDGYMDLNFDYLGKDKSGRHMIALSHYYELNGDMVPDPDMHVRIDTKAKTAEAMTFQNLYIFQRVYDEGNEPTAANEKRKKELNLFLSQWLSNSIEYGYRIDFSKADRALDNLRRRDGKNPEQGIER